MNIHSLKVFALVPTLERMKKHDFDNQELAEKLHEKGIEMKAPTLVYISERVQARKGAKARYAPAASTN